jgi:hypothetical protein
MKPIPNFRSRISDLAVRCVLPIVSAISLLILGLLRVSAAPQADAQWLLAQADEVLRQMSETTGLPIKAPLKKQLISRPEVEKYLTEDLHAEMTAREIHVQEATLKAFGLVSSEFNLEKFLIIFYTEQAAGFYDPRRKTMFIADWPTPEMQRLALAHELTHALQDQNFDMQKFLRATRDDDDATNTRQAIAEGHATAAMMQQLMAPVELANLPSLEPIMAQVIHQQFEEFPAFSKAPFFFRLQALFPYVEGMGFMQRGLQLGGWQKLNSIFADPPRTTKEIFEPGIYFEKRALPRVSLSPPAALANVPGLQVLAENVMGELGYYALLGQLVSEDEAKAVATGWLADRYILYEGPPAAAGLKPTHAGRDYALVGRTRWESSETALAFFRDYHTLLAHKYPELTPDKRSAADLFVGSAANGQVILLRKGDECLWAEGVPTEKTDAMLSWLESL